MLIAFVTQNHLFLEGAVSVQYFPDLNREFFQPKGLLNEAVAAAVKNLLGLAVNAVTTG
jgi:hypothetical protein